MDSLFEELVAVDSRKALSFFQTSLSEAAGTMACKDDETWYVASVLAHYSQTSRSDPTGMPVMAGLAEVFDELIIRPMTMGHDSEILEIGGSQILLFAGFFRDQMSQRHNVRWYDQVGQSLYGRAAQYSSNLKKQQLFDRLSESFPVWTIICRDLSRTLRDNRFLVKLS